MTIGIRDETSETVLKAVLVLRVELEP